MTTTLKRREDGQELPNPKRRATTPVVVVGQTQTAGRSVPKDAGIRGNKVPWHRDDKPLVGRR